MNCQQQIPTRVPPVWHSESGGRRNLQPAAASAGSPSPNSEPSLPGRRRHTAVSDPTQLRERKEIKLEILYSALSNKLAKTTGLRNPICGVTDLFLALSSIRSGLKYTSWSSWAQSGSWFCQTQPPPIPPCSAWLQTGSRSRRRASRRCCLREPHEERYGLAYVERYVNRKLQIDEQIM